MSTSSRPDSVGQWIRHFVVYGLGIASLNALSFLVIPIYTRRITPVEYGILELLNRAQDVLAIAVLSGFSLAALAFFQFEKASPQRQGRVFSTALIGILLNGLLLSMLVLPFAGRISLALFQSEQYAWAIYLFVPLVPLEMVFNLGLVSLQARFQSIPYVLLGVGRFAIGLTLNLVMVYWLRMGLRGILLATVIHTVIPSVVVTILIMQKAGWSWEYKLWKQLLRYGLPFIPGGIFLFILNSGDRYLLNLFHGQAEVGIYAISYKFASIATFALVNPFLKVWGPVMIDVALHEDGKQNLARVTTNMTAAYVYGGLLLSLLSPWVLRRLVTENYQGAGAAIPVLVLAYLFWAISIVGDTVFYSTKKTEVKPLILGSAAVFCISWYLILIPRYGSLGAAWATVISFAFFALVTLRVGRRYLPIDYHYGKMGAILAVGIALFVAGKYLADRGVSELLCTFGAMLIFPACMWGSGLWTQQEKLLLIQTFRNGAGRLRSLIGPAD